MDYTALILENLPAPLVQKAKAFFNGQDPAHDWYHNLRVMGLCERLGREEKADMTVLRLAALLHDIGRAEELRTKECHAQISARKCVALLQEEGYDSSLITVVQKAILTHRFRKNNPPTTLEERILFDADKLDSIGAIGVARAFAYSGVIGQSLQAEEEYQHTPLKEFEGKLSLIKERLFTSTARKMAKKRHEVMVQFFARWVDECKSNC